MILGEHWHLATGHESKNKGQRYLCANKGKNDPFGCCIVPAWSDAEGKQEIQG